MTLNQAAKIACRSTSVISYWITTGRLRAKRGADGAFDIDRADLEAAIALGDRRGAARRARARKAAAACPN